MPDKEIPSVDINKGSLETLISINGIGPSLAQGIITHRPYQTLDDLVRVPGINANKLKALIPYLKIETAQVKITSTPKLESPTASPVAKLGHTEAFVFLEDRNERQDALLIIFGGFILGLLLLMLRRSSR